jgi:hypothetical protein
MINGLKPFCLWLRIVMFDKVGAPEVSMTPLEPPQRVIDTPGAKIGDFIVEYLREFEAIWKKALTR